MSTMRVARGPTDEGRRSARQKDRSPVTDRSTGTPGGCASWSVNGQPQARIDGVRVDANLEVQVAPGGVSRRARDADEFAGSHRPGPGDERGPGAGNGAVTRPNGAHGP